MPKVRCAMEGIKFTCVLHYLWWEPAGLWPSVWWCRDWLWAGIIDNI